MNKTDIAQTSSDLIVDFTDHFLFFTAISFIIELQIYILSIFAKFFHKQQKKFKNKNKNLSSHKTKQRKYKKRLGCALEGVEYWIAQIKTRQSSPVDDFRRNNILFNFVKTFKSKFNRCHGGKLLELGCSCETSLLQTRQQHQSSLFQPTRMIIANLHYKLTPIFSPFSSTCNRG